MAESNYRLLIEKLDEFIRKYYQNLLVRGLIWTAAIMLSGYLLLSFLEYYVYLSVGLKTFLFFLFLGLSLGAFAWFVLVPLLAYFRLGKVIDHSTAAQIIGRHFREVEDKLLNTLQLHEMARNSVGSRDLILASIDQRIGELRPIPFTAAIDFRKNRKFLHYAIVPAGIIILVLFAAPGILKEGTYRLVHYNRFFEKPAPFQFMLMNEQLRAVQNGDFILQLKMQGNTLPAEVYLLDENNYPHRMDKENNVNFSYTFRNLQKSQRFRFSAGGFTSREYSLEVLPRPQLLNFEVRLDYPAYLNKEDESLRNTGELLVPEGTHIRWDLNAEHTERLLFVLDGKTDTAAQTGNGRYHYELRAMKPASYALIPQNPRVEQSDSAYYSLQVVPDRHPLITVRQQADSLSSTRFYYIGEISDDYGLSKLNLHYTRNENGEEKTYSKELDIRRGSKEDRFFYHLNTAELDIRPGESVSCYFEVFDNDGVNGPKSTRSGSFELTIPDRSEQAEEVEKSRTEVKSKLSEAASKASQLRQSAQKLSEMLIQKESLNFEEKAQVRDLIEEQRQLEEFLNEIREEQKRAELQRSEMNLEENKALQEKQKQIQELFDKVLDEETKKIIEELEKLLEENNKNLTREELSKLQLDNRSLERELDRILELYKQLEVEQLLQEKIDQLEKLAGEQEELGEKTEQSSGQEEAEPALEKEQEELNEEFRKMEEEFRKLEEKNAGLERSTPFQNPEEEQKSIRQEMEKSLEQLQQNQPQKAGDSQKSASEQMQKLSKKLQQMQQQMAGMELSINIQALRQILDNLLKASFDQESLMQQMRETNPNDPLFLELSQKQRFMKDDIEMVRDSVYALSKRVPQLNSFVNKETEKIDQHLEAALTRLSERKVPEVLAQQQFVMTSLNNLAVMLSEVFDQLQQQMNNSGSGSGRSQPQSAAQLRQMQEELNQRLQQMKQGLKPGERAPRELSEQIARMAREQEAIRRSLQRLNQELNKDGQGKLGNLEDVASEMEKTETDLYNKRLTEELLKRQKEITTRLLDAEKAEREQDTDKERESAQGTQFSPDFSKVLEEFNKEKERQLELIQTLPAEVSSFYREKISEYFMQLREGGEGEE